MVDALILSVCGLFALNLVQHALYLYLRADRDWWQRQAGRWYARARGLHVDAEDVYPRCKE